MIGRGVKAVFKWGAESRAGQYISQGNKANLRAAKYGIGAGLSYYFYGDTLGGGGAALYGIAGALPIAGNAILLGELGHAALEYGNSVHKRNRQLQFGRLVEDRFGTMQQMRMHSMQQLQRSRASTARFMGNEARYYHNR